MTFVAGATKINLKNLKTWRHQLWKVWAFGKLWQKYYLSLNLKALKASSHLNFFNSCDHIVVCIAVLLPMQQSNITKMMMFTFSIIAVLSYLYFACLVCWVLENAYFKEHPWVINSKYSICNRENNT